FTTQHGVLVDVYGLGVLLLGDSGVGKSECALDLVVRGHRLVSDDVVQIRRIGANLVGTGVDLTRYHMEVRGLGIINVKELFGVAAVRQRKFVELIIRLDPWKAGVAYERLGLDERTEEILDTSLPLVTTGLSGAGKSLAARVFEDLGYYCVDNLPVSLIPVFADLVARSQDSLRQVALVIDIREGAYLHDFPKIVAGLRTRDVPTRIL